MLSEANEGEHIVLNNMNFQPGKHYLTSVSQPELEILLNTLVENPKLEIEIQGHICLRILWEKMDMIMILIPGIFRYTVLNIFTIIL